jgi:hypothetical protein
MQMFCANCQCFNVCKFEGKRSPDLCKYYSTRRGLRLTPKEYREVEGHQYPETWMVYAFNAGEEKWEMCEYWRAKQIFNDLRRLDKDFGEEPQPDLIVCAYNLPEMPAVDWRPR